MADRQATLEALGHLVETLDRLQEQLYRLELAVNLQLRRN